MDHIGNCHRLNATARSENLVYSHLFPKGIYASFFTQKKRKKMNQSLARLAEFANHEEDVWLDTNLLELSPRTAHLISTMNQLLTETLQKHGSINVISGLSRRTSSLFYVVTTCLEDKWNLTSCPTEQRDMQAFILPTESKFNEACLEDREFIAYHVATLEDVERITQFHFFPDLPLEEKLIFLTRTTLASNLVINLHTSRIEYRR